MFLTPELKVDIADQLARVREIEREMSTIIPWLFPHLHGRQQGKRIKSFRKIWTKACREAECPGKLRHDWRRTAARNMINLGYRSV
jgi:integrase